MADNDEPRPYLTSGDAARQLGISVSSLRRAVRRGEINPAISTAAGHSRFSLEDVENLRFLLDARGHPSADNTLVPKRRAREQSIGRRASDYLLRVRQEFLQALTDHFTDLVMIVDVDGRILYASPSHSWILGYEPGELLGTNVQTYVHPEDAHDLRAALPNVTPQGGLSWPSNVRILHCNGTWHIFEVVIRNRLEDRAIGAIVINALDVTERSLLVEELQRGAREADAMARLSGALAAELDPELLYVLILEHAAALIPCDQAIIHVLRDGWVEIAASWGEPTLPVGTRLFPVTTPPKQWMPDPSWPISYLADTTLEPVWQDSIPWVGDHKIRSVIGVPFVHNGEMLGFLTISSRNPQGFSSRNIQLASEFGDRITHALRRARLFVAEQERARAAAELAALRSDFVATVSHELRTPMASILGYGEALQAYWHETSDEMRRDWVAKIVFSANRQKRLIDDLLLLTVMDAGRMGLRQERFALASTIDWAAMEVRGSYPGQVVELEGPPGLAVLADPDRVQQIVANLIDNAAKYSPDGSSISVRWSRSRSHAVLRVCDSGTGIPPEGLNTLFTRFGRLAGSPIRAGRWGTGLGLYLGRQLAQAMGGTLELENTGPTGSVFVLRLPIAPHT